MSYLFHVLHDGDLYEVTCDGYVINRLVRYGANQMRKEVDFDDLTTEVKMKIVEKMGETLNCFDEEK